MGICAELDSAVANDLKRVWGGDVPKWDDFKRALKDGRVSVNNGIALKYLEAVANTGREPKIWWLIYGIIVPWFMMATTPVAAILWLIHKSSGFMVVASVGISWFLYKVSINGACRGILSASEVSEAVYLMLAGAGAFYFEPKP